MELRLRPAVAHSHPRSATGRARLSYFVGSHQQYFKRQLLISNPNTSFTLIQAEKWDTHV